MKILINLIILSLSLACAKNNDDNQELDKNNSTNLQKSPLVEGNGSKFEFDNTGPIELYIITNEGEENREFSNEELDLFANSIDTAVNENLNLTGFKFPWSKTKKSKLNTPKAPPPPPIKTPEAPPSPTQSIRSERTSSSSSTLEVATVKIEPFAIREPSNAPGSNGYREIRVSRVVDFDINSKPRDLAEKLPFGKEVFIGIPKTKLKDGKVTSKNDLEEEWTVRQLRSLSNREEIDIKVIDKVNDLSGTKFRIVSVIKTYDPKTLRQANVDRETQNLILFERFYFPNGQYSLRPID